MMKKFNLSADSKALLTAGLLSLAMTGCSGDDGKNGEDGKPGPVGLTVAEATSLKVDITSTEIVDGIVKVNFDLTNSNGVAITDLDTYENVDTLGMGIAKLVPQGGKGYKTPQWVSYNNKMVDVEYKIPPGFEDKAAPQIQAIIEGDCKQECLIQVSPGEYTYTFKLNLSTIEPVGDLDLTYDDSITHRITMELRADKNTNKLVNTHFDFLPSSGDEVEAEDTRTITLLEESCLRCHSDDYDHYWASKLIMHGDKRFALENCQVCHTSYSADPETGTPLDLGYMIHKLHKSDYLMVGHKGSLHDYQDLTFPADMYDCRTCHQEKETSPVDAGNFKHHTALACGSCHSGSTDPQQIKTDMHEKYIEKTECSTCHAEQGEQGAGHHMTDAIAKDNAKDAYSAKLVDGSVSLDSGMITFKVSYADSSLTGDVTSPDADKRINYSTIYFGFGNETDFETGKQSYKLKELTPTAASEGVYTYTEAFSLTPSKTEAATAVITTKMCVDRDTLAGVECGAGTDPSINPAVIVGELVAFNLNGDEEVTARRTVISNETCANCHDEKFIGKFGIDFKHGGNYANFEGECQMCHNPTYSDRKPIIEHIDFKVRIHALHASKFGDKITFPEHYGDCSTCHDKGQLSMKGLSKLPATTATDAELGKVEFSPIAATCVSCHGVKSELIAHIRSEGGAANDTVGTYTPGSEGCATCHAEGAAFGVDKLHPVNYK
ncbi:OmcA/MtrC family decaheme c-type cytochrome [Shewanella sp. 0m-8]